MTAQENPAPCANAGSRADTKAEHGQHRATAIELEADAAADWFATRLSVPSALACVLAALASLGRAFG